MVGNRFQFTAREYDSETGLHYYRARSYSADLGRFLQLDPIDFDAGDVNLFRYVGNDPVNWVDPSGQNAGQIALGMRELAGHSMRSLPRGAALLVAGTLLGTALILESLEENAEEGDDCPAANPNVDEDGMPLPPGTKLNDKGEIVQQEDFDSDDPRIEPPPFGDNRP